MQGDIYIRNNLPGVPAKVFYATIDAAVAAAVANDVIVIESGDYTLVGPVDITKPGISIIGDGNVTINGAPLADYCFRITLGVLKSTAGITIANLTINHSDDATQMGIQIVNTGATKKINLYLSDVEFGSDGGDSIHQYHGDLTAAIRIYCIRCTTEGPVNLVVGNAGDRFRFAYGNLRGGLVSDAGAYAAEILIAWSTLLLNSITGGASQQRVIFVACVTETDADPNVYLGAVAGDVQTQTPQIALIPGA
jgi:hypothetical protein